MASLARGRFCGWFCAVFRSVTFRDCHGKLRNRHGTVTENHGINTEQDVFVLGLPFFSPVSVTVEKKGNENEKKRDTRNTTANGGSG